MNKGRSSYNFRLNGNSDKAEQLMQSYIKAKGFKLIEKKGEKYYRGGDIMVEGYRYFDYKISGDDLTVYAWLKGAFGDISIEQGGIASINMPIMNYRKSLTSLFQEIEKLSSENSEVSTDNSNEENNREDNEENNEESTEVDNTSQNIDENKNNSNEFSQKFEDETVKKQEKLCEIGFWLSIVGVVLSLLGITYGVIIYMLNFYFASQGLKTRKRGKAIATIVLSIISIFIIICEIMLLSAYYA